MKKNNVMQNIRPVILSAHSVILSAAKNLFLLAVIAGLTGNLLASCQKDLSTEVTGGKLKDEAKLDANVIVLRSSNTTGCLLTLRIPEGARVQKRLFISQNHSALEQVTYDVYANPKLVDTFNTNKQTDYLLLPQEYYSFYGGNQCVVFPDMRNSSEIILTISSVTNSGTPLHPGKYVLPLEASYNGVSTPAFYYVVDITDKFYGDVPLYDGEDFMIVFYVNTNDYQPMLASEWYNQKFSPKYEKIWDGAIGNIVNLRTVTITGGVDGDVRLNLGSDMRYVLDHFDKYILPLQQQGRKVCITIEGGNSGLGFCNLTEEQISSLVNQIVNLFNLYPIDGINFWDRNSGYEKDKSPRTNTTSYPKLIKTLREALGQKELITVTDYESPTEYFWDTEATGGIEVGKYIDYAWSGYNSKKEAYQIVDPYHQGASTVSALHPRKPIAGLNASKYGCINVTWYPKKPEGVTWDEIWESESNIQQWVSDGLKQNNIFVYDDLMTSLQNEYEGTWAPEIHFNIDSSLSLPFTEQNSYSAYTHIGELNDGSMGYGKWLKDW